jgi:hypothetical protein
MSCSSTGASHGSVSVATMRPELRQVVRRPTFDGADMNELMGRGGDTAKDNVVCSPQASASAREFSVNATEHRPPWCVYCTLECATITFLRPLKVRQHVFPSIEPVSASQARLSQPGTGVT